MSEITIRNKLEVLPGGVLRIPGCEPLSAFTTPSMRSFAVLNTSPEAVEKFAPETIFDNGCEGGFISLETALEVIPGSTVEIVLRPTGSQSTGQFFVLPDGPPPQGNECPCVFTDDWYRILKENTEPLFEPPETDDFNERVGFFYSGCPTIQDHTPIPL